ncbi:MAG: diacylglycerol kinase family protein [Armatimonadota bacterium]|nr:diacylglycerol kinase family protein [Armatimonadota bacterium]MDR7519172.1 diacylglycerol kinase family protein [Armatimonadota bacterium]
MRHTLWQSFQYAGRGLQAAFWSQRTMRIHILLAAAVILAVVWLDLSVGETALLVVVTAGVLAAELFNTAVEAIVDLEVGDNHHALAGRAKDLSAAAVLVMAAGAAIVGLLVLAPPVMVAFGFGRLDALAAGRAGVLAAILALAAVTMRRAGDRSGPGAP